jgi:hypothetical protein
MAERKIFEIHSSFRVIATCTITKPSSFLNAETEGLFEYIDMGCMGHDEEEAIIHSRSFLQIQQMTGTHVF